ncbi:MAG: hypothetical protein M1834_002388 [Cirrosporium novae-zelandiae]|nr:MAG: hypothetical protein M1834_002388 [Cirrosporium novae-zelandiae]
MLTSLYLFLFILSTATAAVLSPRNTTVACNNSPDLCDRAYSNITHLGAHDSAFLRDSSTDYSDFGNQYYNATVALSAGVRLLSAQVHKSDGEWHLCHTSCDYLDAGLASTWLAKIKYWMDENPHEVVTILLVNSDDATADELNEVFTNSSITEYVYTPTDSTTAPTSWPTLQELINNGTRLLTFIASLDPDENTDHTYLMDEFTFIWENPYDVTSLTNFSCKPDRPTSVKGSITDAMDSNRMPFMNHFVYSTQLFGIEEPDVDNITVTNAPSGKTGNLGDTAQNCTSQYGQAPVFILVDFFDQGPAIKTVDTLNGITAVGRTKPVNTTSQTSGSSSSKSNVFKGLVDLTNSVLESGATPKLGQWIWVGGDWSGGLGAVDV